MKKPLHISTRYRLGVASRCLAACLGGYAVASAASSFVALLMPGAPAQTAIGAMMLGFVVYVGAVIWAFACRTALKAWLGIGGSTLVLALAALGLYRVTGA
jgi:hypothetical protein